MIKKTHIILFRSPAFALRDYGSTGRSNATLLANKR